LVSGTGKEWARHAFTAAWKRKRTEAGPGNVAGTHQEDGKREAALKGRHVQWRRGKGQNGSPKTSFKEELGEGGKKGDHHPIGGVGVGPLRDGGVEKKKTVHASAQDRTNLKKVMDKKKRFLKGKLLSPRRKARER